MATALKFKCPRCGSDKFSTLIRTIDRPRYSPEPLETEIVNRCQGYLVGAERHNPSNDCKLYEHMPCTLVWPTTDNWKYFVAEMSFASDSAYQVALKTYQGFKTLGLLIGMTKDS